MKYFRMSYREVVFERSYINLILLNRAIPGIKPIEKDGDDKTPTGSTVTRQKPKNQHANEFFEALM